MHDPEIGVPFEKDPVHLAEECLESGTVPPEYNPVAVETGKLKVAKPILPSEWLETFGLNVDEHTGFSDINLSEGFLGLDEATENAEQTIQKDPMEVH